MVSTYLDYNLLTRNMKTSMERTAQLPLVSRDAAYYKDNIGKITSVDQFLGDYRLYSYAMKAHGLEDMTYAKAFMKKVLESDLSDDNSYANKLADNRYRDFAQAFSFSKSTEVVQSTAQEDALIGLYTQSIVNKDDAIKSETTYFNTVIDGVKNVDQVWQNDRLKSYLLTAVGIDSRYISYEQFRNVVTSDVDDPNSFVYTQDREFRQGLQNQIASLYNGASAEDLANPKSAVSLQIADYQARLANAPNYQTLAAVFNFQPDGTVASGDVPVDPVKKPLLNQSYTFRQPRTTSAAALLNKDFYEAAIGSVTKVSDITTDSRMFGMIKTAFGLPSTFGPAAFENVVTSDLTNPTSYANTNGGEFNATYKLLAAAFNFQADGTLAAGASAQTAAQTKTITDNYMSAYNDKDDAADASLIKSYKTLLSLVSNVDDLFDDSKMMSLILPAFGLENEGDSKRKLKLVMLSDLNDPKSYANSLKDSRYTDLAKAFNFNPDGSIGAPTLAQAESEILTTAKAYVVEKSRFGTPDDKKKATDEATFYSGAIEKVKSLDDLLSNDRLVKFFLTANGFDPEKVDRTELRKMFESDPSDPKSYVSSLDDPRYRDMVASFNFNAKGQLEKPKEAQIQTRRGLLETEQLYLSQTMEQNAGDDNAGVRLALYFRRKADGINSAYDILADSALLQVIQTTFSIPSEMSNADVDLQYAYINRVLDLKDLQDPAKLEKLLARFAALYDVANDSGSSAASLILGGNSGGISADLLYNLTQLRAGGA